MSFYQESTPGQRAAKPAKSAPRRKKLPPQSPPFDPDDLARRLYAVLAEQKAQSERRRASRAQAEKSTKAAPRAKDSTTRSKQGDSATAPTKPTQAQSSHVAEHRERNGTSRGTERSQKQPSRDVADRPNSTTATGSNVHTEETSTNYHHTPLVAASQFSRTTMTDGGSGKTLAHKLSKTAMKFHMAGPNASRGMIAINSGTAPSEQTKALKRAQSQRDRQYSRNQFQNPSILEVAAESDENQPWQAQRHTLETHFQRKSGDHWENKAGTRLSAGSLNGRIDITTEPIDMPGGMVPIERVNSYGDAEPTGSFEGHRVDWTQSDEAAIVSRPTSPHLRKLESKLSLRGRFGSLGRHDKVERIASPPPQAVIPEEPALKASKSRFFDRFKR